MTIRGAAPMRMESINVWFAAMIEAAPGATTRGLSVSRSPFLDNAEPDIDETISMIADEDVQSLTQDVWATAAAMLGDRRDEFDPNFYRLTVTLYEHGFPAPVTRGVVVAHNVLTPPPRANHVQPVAYCGSRSFPPMHRESRGVIQIDRSWLAPHGRATATFFPIWPGFAFNTILYAAIWYAASQLVTGAIGALIRRLRCPAGHCPKCRYDLEGDLESGCPECGWNRIDDPSPQPAA